MTTAFNEYIQQFTRQSGADSSEWRTTKDAILLQDLINSRTSGGEKDQIAESAIIIKHFDLRAQIVAPTDGKSVRAIHAPNMAIINIPLITN